MAADETLAPEVARALRTAQSLLASAAPPPGDSHRTVDEEHPWLGLASFTEETRGYFFGREAEIAELSRRVQRKLLTILFGQSGLGKTSILRAGIVPKLRPMGYCPVYVRIDYASESPPPAEQIKQAIFRATEAHGQWTQPGSAASGESLWEFLHHRDDVLKDGEGNTVVPLLIFDQFEEIFTLAQADEAGRKRAAEFIEDLSDLVENRPPKAVEAKIEGDEAFSERFDFARADYRILIALREDYLAHLEGVKAAMPSITQNRMRLAPMTGHQALAAVRRPGGKLVSEEVAESIVRFIAGGSEIPNAEVEPSLLSLICRELNNARISQERAEISVDLLAGSNETILAEFYERALADQPAAVRRFIEDEMLTDSGYRESLAEERVRKAFNAAGASQDALARLVDRRLLRIEERLDLRRVELTHDVLCTVVAATRDMRHEREARDAAEKQLAEQKAREAATRKALVRARKVAAGCAVLAVLAIMSAVWGVTNMNRARDAEAKAQQVQAMAERARGESEKLIVYLLDDFYTELFPVGRLDIVAELAKSALSYYRELPAELRSVQTERNRALALVRYAGILNGQGKSGEGGIALAEAVKVLAGLRSGGDNSEETLLGHARARMVQGQAANGQANFVEAITAEKDALEMLKPLLARPDPSRKVREIEGGAMLGLGFAELRQGVDGVIPTLERTQEIFRAMNARELGDFGATSGYIGAGWMLGEALVRDGRHEVARPVLEETVTLADRLLVAQPAHRPAMRAKALAAGWLALIEFENLRLATALKLQRDVLAVKQKLVDLDPTSSSAWNNLAVTKNSIAGVLWRLGQVEESLRYQREVVAIPPTTQVDGFMASNLTLWNGWFALALVDAGDTRQADAAIAASRKFARLVMERSGSRGPLLTEFLEAAEAAGTLWRGNPREAASMAREVRARLKAIPPEGKLGEELRHRAHRDVLRVLALATYAMGDFAGAEAASREAVEVSQRIPGGVRAQSDAHESRIELAKALARLGRHAEARQQVGPALGFFRDTARSTPEDLALRVNLAHALLASALADPAQRQANLGEGALLFDALPAKLRSLKSHAAIRAEIAAEQAKRG